MNGKTKRYDECRNEKCIIAHKHTHTVQWIHKTNKNYQKYWTQLISPLVTFLLFKKFFNFSIFCWKCYRYLSAHSPKKFMNRKKRKKNLAGKHTEHQKLQRPINLVRWVTRTIDVVFLNLSVLSSQNIIVLYENMIVE
jgi:hypothetical protein